MVGKRARVRVTVPLICVTLAAVATGCAGTPGPASAPERKELPPAAEAAPAPPLAREPAGRVIRVGPVAKGIVADPATGLVAVAVREPPRLVLLDGETGNRATTVRLPAAARHLGLARPRGPVLVPAEQAGDLVKVSLPAGKVTRAVPVGSVPHDSTRAGGRLFVTSAAQCPCCAEVVRCAGWPASPSPRAWPPRPAVSVPSTYGETSSPSTPSPG